MGACYICSIDHAWATKLGPFKSLGFGVYRVQRFRIEGSEGVFFEDLGMARGSNLDG